MNKKSVSLFLCALLVVPAGLHAEDLPRNKAMKTIGENMKTLTKMAKGEMAFDANAASQGLSTIANTANELPTMFPEGSITEESEASPKIWEDKAGFEATLNKFITDANAAAASNPQDAMTLGGALGVVGKNCKSCHETYRIKKE